MMRKLFNRLIKHERDDEGDFGYRVMLHTGVGFFIGLTFPMSLPLLWLFIRYEENEDKHVKDEAWKDYMGAMVGSGVGIACQIALWCYAIYKLVGVLWMLVS